MATVEALGESKHRGEDADGLAALPREVAVVLVPAFWRRLTMIARNEPDNFYFFRLEAPEIAVLDEVVGMLMVALVADVYADVVQQSGELEPFAFAVRQAVHTPRLVKQHRRQLRDLLRVFGPVVAALAQFDHAAPPDVRIPIGLRDLFAVPGDVVEDEPFAQ